MNEVLTSMVKTLQLWFLWQPSMERLLFSVLS